MTLRLFPGYCVDTSALIDLGRQYPRTVFLGLWRRIESLVEKGDLVAPREALRELEQVDDEVARWAKKHRCMFAELDAAQIQEVRKILRRFPKLTDPSKEIPDADPFVLALARANRLTVVTSEKPVGPGAQKIPNVCDTLRVPWLNLVAFFERQGWSFQ
jgi:hypothetical protein